ncbi:MAG: HD domain-containing protein [Sphaerochaetaceae bacterium]|nr:HD domain-containing protein [Sphaerochaetaceae bacterium]
MRYIDTFKEGEKIKGVYLCKKRFTVTTKSGKEFDIVKLQDKTGLIDGKIWNTDNYSVDDFGTMDYVSLMGEVQSYNGSLELNLSRATVANDNTYSIEDYMLSSEYDIEEMFKQLLSFIDSVENKYLNKLLTSFFVDDKEFAEKFKIHSAARSIHHGFRGGLLEHTLSVTKNADFFSKNYSFLNRDLLITGAIMHDIAKTKELSPMPENEYTEEGNLMGHLVMGSEMIGRRADEIEGFPYDLKLEMQHMILAHHGELEYGSPKKPALAEAFALNMADNVDATMETIKESLKKETTEGNWVGYHKILDTNLRKTTVE